MIEPNTFNSKDYTQGQSIDLGTNQTNQENTQIDPSTYLQGDTAVLQASAGLDNISTENVDYFTQNNAFQNTYDTNAVYGENIKTTNEIPTTTFGQTLGETTTTNVIDTNNYFGDSNNKIKITNTNEIQGTNIDFNSYFNNAISDTNVIFGQTQVIPTTGTTTTTTTTTKTTDYNYSQTQTVQGTTTYGETQVIPGTDTNNYFTTTQTGETAYQNNQIDFGQPSTQNDFISYQPSGTTDLNNFNFGKTQQLYTTNAPITQTQTTTTTTTTNTITEPQYQTQNYPTPVQNTFETSAYPITQSQYIPNQQPQQQYDLSQFQAVNNLNTINNTSPTTTFINQPETQIIQTQEQTKTEQVIPNTLVQNTFNPLPEPQIQTTQAITTTTYTPPLPESVQNVETRNTFTQPQTQNIINLPQSHPDPQPRIIPLPNYFISKPLAGKIIDEDFLRGRPIYSDIIKPSNKLRITGNKPNLITYRPRIISNHDKNIGLSRLTPSMSYDRNGLNLVSNLNNNQINNNTNIGLRKLTKASSYDVGNQSITPILNNAGFNQNNILNDNNRITNLKNFA